MSYVSPFISDPDPEEEPEPFIEEDDVGLFDFMPDDPPRGDGKSNLQLQMYMTESENCVEFKTIKVCQDKKPEDWNDYIRGVVADQPDYNAALDALRISDLSSTLDGPPVDISEGRIQFKCKVSAESVTNLQVALYGLNERMKEYGIPEKLLMVSTPRQAGKTWIQKQFEAGGISANDAMSAMADPEGGFLLPPTGEEESVSLHFQPDPDEHEVESITPIPPPDLHERAIKMLEQKPHVIEIQDNSCEVIDAYDWNEDRQGYFCNENEFVLWDRLKMIKQIEAEIVDGYTVRAWA